MDETRHKPVLWQTVLQVLRVVEGETVIDATLGGGGHTLLFQRAVGVTGQVLSLDTDQVAIDRFLHRTKNDTSLTEAMSKKKLVLVHANFANLAQAMERVGLTHANVIFADLGYSSDQIEDGDRGFSFLWDGPLDMRLNQETTETAAHIVNTWSEMDLMRLFREKGDEECASSIARMIVQVRSERPLMTTFELSEVIVRAIPVRIRSKRKIHPATKVFQALRIAVNDEYANLESFLEQSVECLAPGGRLGVMSFHSGEDRIVKQFFRRMMRGCQCPSEFPVCVCHQRPKLKRGTRDVIVPSEQEISENPRARSAKLRCTEKL